MWIMQIMNIENLTNIEIPVYMKFTNIQIPIYLKFTRNCLDFSFHVILGLKAAKRSKNRQTIYFFQKKNPLLYVILDMSTL
jgi:hypothetical protein